MAVTITIEELQAALRLGDTAEETAEVTRLLAYATEAVTQHAPSATDTSMNEAVRRAWAGISLICRKRPGETPTPTPCETAALCGCCCPTGCTGRDMLGRLQRLRRL